LNGDAKYKELASQVIRVFSDKVKRAPAAHTYMLVGVDFAVGPTSTVILIGDSKEDSMQRMLGALKMRYLTNTVVSMRSPGKVGLGYEKIDDKATAYVCSEHKCMPPTNEPEKMLEFLGVK
jgi:uncharacterized protein YyaL (SSP411 family)